MAMIAPTPCVWPLDRFSVLRGAAWAHTRGPPLIVSLAGATISVRAGLRELEMLHCHGATVDVATRGARCAVCATRAASWAQQRFQLQFETDQACAAFAGQLRAVLACHAAMAAPAVLTAQAPGPFLPPTYPPPSVPRVALAGPAPRDVDPGVLALAAEIVASPKFARLVDRIEAYMAP